MIFVGNSIGKNLLAARDVSAPRPKINPQYIALRRQLIVKMSAQGNSTGAAENGDAELPLQYTQDGRLPKPTKLSLVVKDAVRRWYLEAEREADRGDVKAQALLGQMLTEGYGCEADPVRGRELSEKARRRGYRMQGVYCEI